jgi:hypothetical protein
MAVLFAMALTTSANVYPTTQAPASNAGVPLAATTPATTPAYTIAPVTGAPSGTEQPSTAVGTENKVALQGATSPPPTVVSDNGGAYEAPRTSAGEVINQSPSQVAAQSSKAGAYQTPVQSTSAAYPSGTVGSASPIDSTATNGTLPNNNGTLANSTLSTSYAKQNVVPSECRPALEELLARFNNAVDQCANQFDLLPELVRNIITKEALARGVAPKSQLTAYLNALAMNTAQTNVTTLNSFASPLSPHSTISSLFSTLAVMVLFFSF